MAIEQADVQKLIDTYIAAKVIARIRASAVLTRLVNTNFDDSEIKQEGDTIKIPKRGTLTAKNKAEGTPVSPDSPASDTVDVVLDQHKYVAWNMGDLAKSLASGEGIEYFTDAADVLIEALETVMFDEYANASVSTGTAGTDLTTSSLLDAKLELDNKRCPKPGRVAIISNKDENSLLGEDQIIRADQRGDGGNAFENAEVGRAYGFNIFASPLAPVVDGSPDETHGLAMTPNALGLASRPLEPAPEMSGVRTATITDTETGIVLRYQVGYDLKEMETVHVMDILFGTKLIDDRQIVDLLS
jgi:hypothetical protein